MIEFEFPGQTTDLTYSVRVMQPQDRDVVEVQVLRYQNLGLDEDGFRQVKAWFYDGDGWVSYQRRDVICSAVSVPRFVLYSDSQPTAVEEDVANLLRGALIGAIRSDPPMG